MILVKVWFKPGEVMWVKLATLKSPVGVLDNNSAISRRLRVGTLVSVKERDGRLVGSVKR